MDLLTHQGTRVPTEGATITIRIARSSGKVFQLNFLFGLEVRRQRFNLFEFDRVSLSRAVFVARYQVPLVGRDQELRVFLAANLGTGVPQKKLLRNVDRRSAIGYKGSGGTL